MTTKESTTTKYLVVESVIRLSLVTEKIFHCRLSFIWNYGEKQMVKNVGSLSKRGWTVQHVTALRTLLLYEQQACRTLRVCLTRRSDSLQYGSPFPENALVKTQAFLIMWLSIAPPLPHTPLPISCISLCIWEAGACLFKDSAFPNVYLLWFLSTTFSMMRS